MKKNKSKQYKRIFLNLFPSTKNKFDMYISNRKLKNPKEIENGKITKTVTLDIYIINTIVTIDYMLNKYIDKLEEIYSDIKFVEKKELEYRSLNWSGSYIRDIALNNGDHKIYNKYRLKFNIIEPKDLNINDTIDTIDNIDNIIDAKISELNNELGPVDKLTLLEIFHRKNKITNIGKLEDDSLKIKFK